MQHNRRMEILLNGQARRIDAGMRVADLLAVELLGDRRVAVEVNGQIIPRGRHGEHVLQAGDRVEIVHALGGG